MAKSKGSIPRKGKGKKGKGGKPKAKMTKHLAPRHQIFSETFKSNNLFVNADGFTSGYGESWTASIDSMSQFANYKALYQKYRILRLDWTIIPRFGQSEPNQAEYNVGTSGTFQGNALIHIVKDWTVDNPPVNELAMLQRQGVRTHLLNSRPLKVSMRYPVTAKNTFVQDISGSAVSENCKNEWCSFDDPISYPHGQMYTYVVTSPSGNLGNLGAICGTVYCKVTFAVADPR